MVASCSFFFFLSAVFSSRSSRYLSSYSLGMASSLAGQRLKSKGKLPGQPVTITLDFSSLSLSALVPSPSLV
jgi:hypothetical protein